MNRQVLRIKGYGATVAEGYVDIEDLGRPRRLRRALRMLGGWWVGAVACVFIPVAHFVLVPFCVLGGLVAAAVRFQATTRIAAAEGTCPDCGARGPLELPRAPRFPCDVACRACRRALTLTTR